MLISNYDAENLEAVHGISMSDIDGAGVGAAWVKVAPGGYSRPEQHDETETWTVVRGTGLVIVDGVTHPVAPGTVVTLEPFETHQIRNAGQDDLVFTTFYWRRPERAVESALSQDRRRFGERPLFVFSTPPAPDGDLHLGQLGGPYLAADTFVRFQRMNGADAWHLTGSDDFRSHVAACALREGRTPAQTAADYSARIAASLALMAIEPDQYTVTSTDRSYQAGLRHFFTRLVDSGRVRAGQGPARFVLPLGEFGAEVTEQHNLGRVPARLKELAARLFAREDLDGVPLTQPSSWGVPPAEPDADGQVIWAGPATAYGFLYGIESLGQRLGKDWQATAPQPEWKIVHFLGDDNGLDHATVYPVLYHLAFPDWQPDIDYHVNEFYRLDGEEFSTSRRHPIWAGDLVGPDSVDAVRFYLGRIRSEGHRTDFTRADYERVVADVLIGTWQDWLSDLGGRIESRYGSLVPDAGGWTPEHTAFLGQLAVRLMAVTGGLGQDGFSLNRATAELGGIVTDARTFARQEGELAEGSDEARTAIALELAAAKLLAQCAAPLMPRFADRLAEALGLPPPREWPRTVMLVPPGTRVALATAAFFGPAATSRAGGGTLSVTSRIARR
jgi:methionyl-tRNA synthetase